MPSRLLVQRWLPVVLVFGFAGTMLWGYVTDDTWIHLRYAKHLIERGELSFNPGLPTYGATSPLWIFGLVMLLKLGIAPVLSTKILGLASALLAMLLASRLIQKLDIPPAWSGWVMGLVVLDAWFQRWTFSGMETPLAGALLLVLLLPVLSRTRVPWLAWGAAAGLAALCRPEFNLLALGAAPWLLWRERRHHADASAVRGAALAIAGWALIYGPWLAYAWTAFGRLTPETAAAKSYGLTFDPVFLAVHLFRTLKQLAMVQGFLWLAAVYVGVRYLAVWRRREGVVHPGTRLTALTGVTLTWLAILAGGFAVKQVWIISRYVSPLLVPLLLVLSGWAGLLVPRTAGRGRGAKRVLLVCAVMALTINAFVLNQLVRPHAVAFSRGVETCFYGTGEWLAANTPADAVIAAHDIGALGYASERRILDLAGLVSPEILELGREMGFEAMVASGVWLTAEVPDYVYDRTQGPARWENVEMYGTVFELVATCVVDGVGLREDQPWTYALYRLHPAVDTITRSGS
mgnify:CR=1 FL=1